MRVLLVDDEVRLAEGIRRGLEAEGMTVDVAHNGVDGLWRAREQDYDVVVLDVMMPGMSGYRVCQSMRAEEIWTPVLFLTAKDGEWDEVEGFETGADDWLTKPFSYPVLVARLRSLVRRGATARPATFSAGDLVLDPAARTVHRGDTEIELTAREFAVLEFLMRHPAEVVTKLEVLDNVWDDAFDGDPNIVEVYIGRLRRKVDRPFGRDGIQTLRGAGYRMAADGG
ncbi:MAG: DNA-binding response regulator [Microbacterium sp.]|uniref:response regulator transcription factor n=1 Tax=unclassified Microbacterium TaxID=2609290 RepID=UPI000C6ACD95|nr:MULTISPECIES: response regulator transcription factor [unclassified Microbacterium]MAY51277.1 DNA-binding response regulator [Microbacterium sp.]HBS74278.1 DNA-binding response regulator [Microbacterium sp.]|tara:strand:+ start:40224 stop:40901 length:678 start_codon:yes stop_codon:yes gene_type:complete